MGKPPSLGCYCLSACVERIRLLRNSISGHSTNGTIGDVQFEDSWQELKTSVVEIEKEVIGSDKYERGIDHLHDCDLNPTKSKEYIAQIRRIRGEVCIKRERIDMVENACIEIGEEIDAKKARLDKVEKSVSDMKVLFERAVQNQTDEILREVKSSELRIQQKINESNNTNIDRTPSAEFEDIHITRTTTTKIKFEIFLAYISICATFDKKCWLGFHVTVKGRSLYLLHDSNVIKKVDIPDQYALVARWSGMTTNDKGEALFISNQSVIAATQDGTVYKLFDIPLYDPLLTSEKFCILHSGNYLFAMQVVSDTDMPLSIHEFSRDGVLLHKVRVEIILENFSDIRQNHNGDIVLTGYNSLIFDNLQLIILDDNFTLKRRILLAERGVVVPCMNSRSDLLYGHGQTIDLLRHNGEFVKTVYTTHKDKHIANIAYSRDGTAWILCSFDEVEILKLKI